MPLRRSWGVALFAFAALLFILNQGYWADTVTTLVITFYATLASMLIGVPVGIAAGHRLWLAKALRPMLDLMQTLPTFVYLHPHAVAVRPRRGAPASSPPSSSPFPRRSA